MEKTSDTLFDFNLSSEKLINSISNPQEVLRVSMNGMTHSSILLIPGKKWDHSVKSGKCLGLEFNAVSLNDLDPEMSGPVILEVTVSFGNEQVIQKNLTVNSNKFADTHWEHYKVPVSKTIHDGCTITFEIKSAGDHQLNKSSLVVVGSPVMIYESGDTKLPNVFVILLDALRADRLGCYGCDRACSPFIDTYSRRSVVYPTVISASSWTRPAVESLLSGQFTFDDRPKKKRINLAASAVSGLPAQMSGNGYYSIGISSNIIITPENYFDLGFDVFDIRPADYWHEGAAMAMYDRAVEHLQKNRDRPVFLYFHCMDPHDEYRAPEIYNSIYPVPKGQVRESVMLGIAGQTNTSILAGEAPPVTDIEVGYLHSRYLAEIRYVDAMVRQLICKIQDLEMDRESLVFILSDHGEAFMEHGILQHAQNLYDELLRVPVIVHHDVQYNSGKLVKGNHALADVFPTIFQTIGMSIPEQLYGQPLSPAGTDTMEPRTLFSRLHDLRNPEPSWRSAHHEDIKLIISQEREPQFYDLSQDPGELNSLPVPESYNELLELLNGQMKTKKKMTFELKDSSDSDDGYRQNLKALGYIQ